MIARNDRIPRAGRNSRPIHVVNAVALLLWGGTAYAATPNAGDMPPVPPGRGHATPTHSRASAESISVTGSHNVTGGGLMAREVLAKSISSVGQAYIATQNPGANSLQLARQLPGVTVASGSPLGGSNEIHMSSRGLDQPEIGYLLDDVPLNFVLTGNPNIQSWTDSENIERISFAQGASDIQDASYSEVGGSFVLKTRDPSKRFGGFFDASYGSYDTHREFIRLDTGELGNSGVSAYASFSDVMGNNWRGPGGLERRHVDAKLKKVWNDRAFSSIGLTYDNTLLYPYMKPTLALWKQNGISNNYSATYKPGSTNYYKTLPYDWVPLELSMHNQVTTGWGDRIEINPYVAISQGYGDSSLLTNPSPNYVGNRRYNETLSGPSETAKGINSASVQRIWDVYEGANMFGVMKRGISTTTVGYWVQNQHGSFGFLTQPVGTNGVALDQTGRASFVFSDGTRYSTQNASETTLLNSLYISEKISILQNHLTIEGGFKEVFVNRSYQNYLPGGSNGSMFETRHLPRVQIRWAPNEHHQVFVDGTTNFMLPPGNSFFENWRPASGTKSKAVSIPPDEYSIAEEIGYRYTGAFNATVTFFNANITNRQVTTSTDPTNPNAPTQTVSGGGQTNRGIDGEIGTRRYYGFSAYVSGEYLHASEDNNIPSGGLYLPTRGKSAVRSPKWQIAFTLNYEHGPFFADFDIKHVASQYSTFMNDEKMPAYTIADLGLGYRFKNIGPLRVPEFKLNFSNIGDNHYLAGINSVTGNASGHPTYFVGSGFGMFGTIATGF
ncbi:TonB-dependent receptor plug domain-containing protein [Gluconacetobacter aggeris]|uniref:TonB-dependent receptor plug domain-containing protein n=1 Tax=Gluconacetobacter aggeris TaxID=1286186 RepID=A0A7W4NX32_9PROT|nr:TonB-dependent receptor [Gluconacetobacter aggeris]MBB2169184.1 TonB-dependent receptor plug domain-containing protein [Gluconacetobacter aggeris]